MGKSCHSFGKHRWKNLGYLKNFAVDAMTILNLILNKQDGRVWAEFIWLRLGSSTSSREHGN